MAANAARTSRACFFIFDPTFVHESEDASYRPTEDEQADAKIMYYSPSCATAEEKRSQVGLFEGLIVFTSMFGGEQLRTVRTQQLAFSVLEVEPHTWMVLAMRHPFASSEGVANPSRASASTGGREDVQYDEDGLSDSTLHAILQNCYGVFRLLHGEIQSYVTKHSMHKLFDLLEDFVPAFLDTTEKSDLGIFHELDGFHYGPVERNTCVSIHCFLSKLQEQYPSIRHSALLYNAHLIYTSLSLSDMRVLYSYLVSFDGAVHNNKLNKGPFNRIPTAASQPGGGSSSFGRAFVLAEEEGFLFGISRKLGPSEGEWPASLFVPAVYLAEGGAGQLVALTYNGIMLVLIFDENAKLDVRLLESVRDACTKASGDGLSLAELFPLIAPQYAQVMEQEDEYRFVYYNRTNHALRLSSQSSGRLSFLGGNRPASAGPKPQERSALCPLRATLADQRLKCREISWKSAERGWICAKRWREREFYLLLDGPNTTLARCQEECANFASSHFSNIFMM